MYLSRFQNEKLLYQHILDENSNKSLNYKAHSHSTYEILFVVNGNVSFVSEGIKYKLLRHDLLLVPPNTFHSIQIESDKNYERFSLAFTPAIAKSIRFSLANETSNTILYRLKKTNEIENIFQKLEYYTSVLSKDAFFDVCQALLKDLCYYLSTNKQHITFSQDTQYSPLLVNILNYINENLFTIKHMTDITSALFISYSYLIKLFRNQFNTSPKKYIMEKRLIEAQKLISQGEKPSVVYEKCGFESYNVFYRSYCAYFGYPPSKQSAHNVIQDIHSIN